MAAVTLTPRAVWILEVGLGSTDSHLRAKLEQGKGYAQQFAAEDVLVCAVLVDKAKGEFCFAWERRDAAGAWAATGSGGGSGTAGGAEAAADSGGGSGAGAHCAAAAGRGGGAGVRGDQPEAGRPGGCAVHHQLRAMLVLPQGPVCRL